MMATHVPFVGEPKGDSWFRDLSGGHQIAWGLGLEGIERGMYHDNSFKRGNLIRRKLLRLPYYIPNLPD